MARSTLLWIDFTDCVGIDDACSLSSQYHIVRVGRCDEIETAIASYYPGVICFNFDTPSAEGLATLQVIKNSHPSLPIIMLTEHHSETLALWAMRARVWDYFVKPVVLAELEVTFKQLVSLKRVSRKNSRQILYPTQKANPRYAGFRSGARRNRTQPSVVHVEQHYVHKITLTDVAKKCCLSPGAFSHLFRKENGVTFSEYILRYRLEKASELLVASDKTVSEIAYAVGFNDASYFSRAFRRIKGVTPKMFRAHCLSK